MPSWWSDLRAPSLEERLSSRSNGFGLLRLALALAVLTAHAWTIGFGWPGLGPLGTATHGQANSLSVYGFFVISGFLITGSGLKVRLSTFAWHRFLRIFPGFWMCLLVTVFLLVPLAAWREGKDLAGVWRDPQSPLDYLWTNWFTAMNHFGVADLLTGVPYGRASGGSVFDGSLWSLKYELACYVVVAALAAAGVLIRRPRLVLGLTAVFYATIVIGYIATAPGLARPVFPGAVGPIPLVGSFNVNQSVYLGFMFLIGAVFRLYQKRVPMHGAIAAAAVVVVVLSLWWGGYVVVGLPAYAYVLLYVAVAAPRRLHGVGRKRDYSYGVYLYSFPVEQMVTLYGGARWGLIAFLAIVVAVTFALAVPSWHLVERPAMSLKDRRLPFRLAQRRPRDEAPANPPAVAGARQPGFEP